VKSNYFQVTGQTIHYVEGGVGEPLILLPSLYLTSKSYEGIGELLAKYYHVYILDIYKGKSAFTNSTTSIVDYCIPLEEFIKGKKIKKYTLIGISASGFVSSYFVRHTKVAPKALFLFSTSYVPLELGSMNIRLIKGYMQLFAHTTKTRAGIKINIRWFTDSIPFFLRHPHQFIKEALNRCPIENTITCVCPTTLVLAEKDEFFSGVPVLTANSLVSGLSIDVVKGNHTWFFDSPEIFVEKVRSKNN